MSLRPRLSTSTQPTTAAPPLEGKLTVNEVRQMLDANKNHVEAPPRPAALSQSQLYTSPNNTAPDLSHADMARILRMAGYIVVEPMGISHRHVPRK